MGNRRSLYANMALAILAPALFLLLAEAALLIAGVKPLALTEDPLVGYASLQPLFVEKEGPSGASMTTNPVKLRHFNAQSFPKKKPEGTYRIFTLGGSTTYGHPWRDSVSYAGWLRELLPAADPTRKWEVINAGGISYASYREAKLTEELARYEPDLIVVYSGHNEFLEERTYREAAEIPAFIRETSAFLDRTRTYTVMRRMLRAFRSDGGVSGDVSASGKDGSGAAGPSGAQDGKTRLAAEVDDVLSRTIGPTSYTRDDALRAGVLEHFRLSLRRMAALAQDAGAQVLFLTTPGNERDCSPFKSEPTPGLSSEASAARDRWLRRADSLDAVRADAADSLERERMIAGAAEALDSAAALDPRNAGVLYRAGKAALTAGRIAEAKRLLVRSLDEDVCPLRALPAMRDIVLETAGETGSLALDITASLESATRQRLGHDILGEPEFVDHVHLSIDEYRNIALGIIDRLAEEDVVKPSPSWNETAIAGVTRKVMSRMGPRELGEGLHNIAKVLNWAGKHEDAARIAAKGLEIDSTGLEAIWSSLFVGAALERQGRSAEAVPHYRRAARLDTTNTMARQYLHDALQRAGRGAEALAEAAALVEAAPGDAEARVRLGTNLFQEGRLAEALPHLEAAAMAAPARSDLLVLLGEALRRLGRTGDAEKTFARALQANPGEGRAYMGLARLAESRGDVPEAINLYARALSASPDLHEARAALSQVLQGMPTSP
jgi:tetratricopeptide (TPR) repeat protein